MKISAKWAWWEKLAAFGVFAFFALKTLEAVATRYEGAFFPVVQDFSIDRIEPVGEFKSRIWGSFEIIRPGCHLPQVSWALRGERRDVGVGLVFEDGNKSRPGGWNDYGPWLVDLNAAQVANNSVVIVTHQCPWRTWRTETHLYP